MKLLGGKVVGEFYKYGLVATSRKVMYVVFSAMGFFTTIIAFFAPYQKVRFGQKLILKMR